MKLDWKPGRQGSRYFVHNLFSSSFLMMDGWLIKYPGNGYVRRHKDPAPGRRHWRLNIELKTTKGKFQCSGKYFKFWRFTLFRPDLHWHCFYNPGKDERLVLSFGISLPGKYTEEPLWNWTPFTEQERLFGNVDYENQIDYINDEMAEKMREERKISYDEWQEQLLDYRLRNAHLYDENTSNI